MDEPGGAAGRVVADLHNHLIPGVDDGAPDLEAARTGLRALAANGVRRLAVTPHVEASITTSPEALSRRLRELDAGWDELSRMAAAEVPDVELHRAAEVMLDIPDPDLSDARLRVGGGPFVLVEFPFLLLPPFSGRVLASLRGHGWTPLIAHPERYAAVQQELRVVENWRAAGAFLQLNGPSLVGRYGPEAQATAEALLEAGLIDYVASDFHTRGRTLIGEYVECLEQGGSEEQARLLTSTNPGRILDGEPPIPVGSVRVRRGLWTRIRRAFR